MVSDDRGMAYALEGFISAVVLLVALLIAVQSVVVSPSAGGSVDRSVQAQLQGEAQDALIVAESEGDLSHVIRYWDPDTEGYYNLNVSGAAPGNYTADRFANQTAMNGTAAHKFGFGELLDERFTQAARSYNVELVYRTPGDGGTESFYLVYQGSPDSSGVSASYMVTLTDDQTLTAPETTATLQEAGNESGNTSDEVYPIPNVDDEGHVYNVVEVRLVIW